MNHLIAHEFTHIAQFEILYGGFWKSARLIKGLSGLEPLWIIEGMAENVSHSVLNLQWTSYDRMILRDAALYDRLYSLRDLQNFNALYRDVFLGYKQGHSAIDYLVRIEGPDVNFKLLKALRNHIDPFKAFEKTAEKFASFQEFDVKWRKDLTGRVNEFVQKKNKISDISEILVKDEYHSKNPVPAGGGDFYYVSDRWLKDEIYLNSQGRNRKILPGFFGSDVKSLVAGRRFDRIMDFNSSRNLLVFSATKNQKDYLFIYDVSRKKLKKIKLDLHEIRSPSFSPDGNSIVFTALKDSYRNIFVYNTSIGKLSQLTDDQYIDYGPVFSPDGEKVLTATERDLNTDIRLIDTNTSESVWLTQRNILFFRQKLGLQYL
jgi:WD40 repeat protein